MADDDSSSDDSSDIFSGLRFLLSGFDPETHAQLYEALEQNGGVNMEDYDDSCTHVVVSRTLLWDDPVCELARKNGKVIVTEIWVSDCLELGVIADVNHVVYRPLRCFEGIPGSKGLVVCLTGYQTHFRKNIMRMVYLMGAKFLKPLVAHSVTHLVCYKFEGEKFILAKKIGLKLVNHQWLEDCLKSWSILPVEKYTKSGEEIELLEAEAKDSEDDGSSRFKARSEHCLSDIAAECPESGKQEIATTDRVIVNGNLSSSILQTSNTMPARCIKVPVHNLISEPQTENTEVETTVAEYMLTDDNSNNLQRRENMRRHSISGTKEISADVSHEHVDRTSEDIMHHEKASKESPKSGQISIARKTEIVSSLKANGTIYNSRHNVPADEYYPCGDSPAISVLGLQNVRLCSPHKENLLTNEHTDIKGNEMNICDFIVNDIDVEHAPRHYTDASKVISGHIQIEENDETVFSPSFLQKEKPLNDSDVLESNAASLGQSKLQSPKKRKSLRDCTMETVPDNSLECTENSTSRFTDTNSEIPCDMQLKITGENIVAVPYDAPSNPSIINQAKLPEKRNVMTIGAEYLTPPDRNQLTGGRKCKSRRTSIVEEVDDINHVECTKTTPLFGSKVKSTTISSATRDNSSKDAQADYGSTLTCGNTKWNQKAGSQADCEENTDPRNLSSVQKVFPPDITVAQSNPNRTSKMSSVKTVKNKGNVHDTDIEDCQKEVDETEVLANHRKYNGKKHDRDMIVEPAESVAKVIKKRATDLMDPSIGAESMLHEREEIGKKNILKNNRRKTPLKDNQDDSAAQKKQVKGSKIIAPKKRCIKKHSSVDAAFDKENAVTLQGQDQKFVSKISKTGSVLKDSRKILTSPSKCMLPNTGGQVCFALSGRKRETKPLQALVKRLGGKLCRDSHQWSHQTTHLVTVGQLRRTEKFFAAAAAGRWILRDDYLKDSADAGVFLDEKKYEWHGSGMTEEGSICLEAPRKWREQREKSGFCALEGLHIVLYGECIIPSLDTLKRAIRAGGAELLATSPPYTRSLRTGVDVAIVSPGTPKTDPWVQEFLNHNLACVTTDFFVSFICTPNSPLRQHVLYDSFSAVDKIVAQLKSNERVPKNRSDAKDSEDDEIRCSVCGFSDREDVMLLCGDDNGNGCGIAVHTDCFKPPLAEVPVNDWFCKQCTKPVLSRQKKKLKKNAT